jgi:hypothetical protein
MAVGVERRKSCARAIEVSSKISLTFSLSTSFALSLSLSDSLLIAVVLSPQALNAAEGPAAAQSESPLPRRG